MGELHGCRTLAWCWPVRCCKRGMLSGSMGSAKLHGLLLATGVLEGLSTLRWTSQAGRLCAAHVGSAGSGLATVSCLCVQRLQVRAVLVLCVQLLCSVMMCTYMHA